MRGAVTELIFYALADLVAVRLARLNRIAVARKGVYGTLQGRVGLQTHDQLIFLLNIARAKGQQRRHVVGIDIQHASLFIFCDQKLLNPRAHRLGTGRCSREEGRVSKIGSIVILNKVTDVDLLRPISFFKSSPTVHFYISFSKYKS